MSMSRTGSIQGPFKHRKTGTTWYRIRWIGAAGKRRSQSVTTNDRRVAQRRLDAKLREAEERRVGLRASESDAPTLEQVAVRTGKEVLPMRQRLRQRLRTQTIIQQWWGGLLDRPVNRIRPADIRSILAERRAQGRSAATCNRALSALSVVFEAARGWGYVEANPCRASNLRQREGRKTPRFLTPDEARRFLLAIPTDPRPRELSWRAFFALALYTGMRESELTGLRWSDVDLDGGRITVRASVDDGDPKSGHHRVLAIHPQIAPLLASMGPQPAEHLVFQGRRRKGAARRDPTQDRVIGTRKPLQRALAAAEIDKHISMHDLRHTFATIAIESGVSLRDLQEMLGHSTLAQTARYVHALGLHAKSVELIDLAIDLT